MKKEVTDRLKRLNTKWLIGVAVVVVAIIVLLIYFLLPPQRSIASFCKIYNEEVPKINNGTYSSSDYAKFAEIYGRLERVAPADIQPDVKVVRQVFEKMDKDPSQSISAGLSGLGAETNIKEWAKKNCVN